MSRNLAEDFYEAALEGDGKTSDETKAVIIGAVLDFAGGTRERLTDYANATTDALIEEALYADPEGIRPCALNGELQKRAAALASTDPRRRCIEELDTNTQASPVFIEALRAVLLPAE
jgi:hypothetical protein